jgi:hypothetical protein
MNRFKQNVPAQQHTLFSVNGDATSVAMQAIPILQHLFEIISIRFI